MTDIPDLTAELDAAEAIVMGETVTRYTSIKEIRAAFYPRMARLLDLDPGELVGFPFLEVPREAGEDEGP